MSKGHGDLGLLDNLRTFSDLVDDSGGSRRTYLGYFPGIQVTGWIVDSGRTYVVRAHYVFDGMLRDVMAVQTDVGNLTRVDSLAECRATAGTYFCDIDAARIASPYWDDGVTTWDGSAVWDSTPPLDLYVHLAGDVDPNGVTVVALLGFFFATRGEVHPVRGGDMLTNGDSDATAWGAALDGGAGLSSGLDVVNFKSGLASTKFANDGTSAGNVSRFEDKTLVVGARYVIAGYYRTDPAFAAGLKATLWIGNGAASSSLDSGGRDVDGTGSAFVQLTPTNGEWRAFWYEFLAPFATTRIVARLIGAAASPGQFNVDRLSLRRIYRHVYWEPRLDAAQPQAEVRSQSIAFGGKTIGLGEFTLLDGDGVLESIFGQLLLHGKPAATFVGGTFGDGQEAYIDDWRAGWFGYTQKVTVTDARIAIQVEDVRSRAQGTLPRRKLSKIDYPNARKGDENKFRACIFKGGSDPGGSSVAPLRLDKVGDYGLYEYGDGATGINGMGGATPLGVYSFQSEALAAQMWVALGGGEVPAGTAFLLALGTHYTWDGANGQITIIDDIRNYMRNRNGDAIWPAANFDFHIGAGALVANLGTSTGLSASQVASTLQASMRAVSGAGDIFVTYSHATHKFTVSKTAGTLTLLPNTGANKQNEAWWAFCGFKLDADKTGALSYTSDQVTFNDCDTDHFLRIVPGAGFQDDAAGTITGTPNKVITKHPDAAAYVLYWFLGFPMSQIDVSSFRAATGAETGNIQCYITEEITVDEFLKRCEIGYPYADIVAGADGVWRWKTYSATGAAARSFFERDFLSFSMVKDPANIFRSVRMNYQLDPASGNPKVYESVQDPGQLVKHGRYDKPVAFDSYSIGSPDPTGPPTAQGLARLLSADPRVVEFEARGKLVDLLIGDRIAITRSRALDPTGALAAGVFRIIGLKHDFISGVSHCIAVENISF